MHKKLANDLTSLAHSILQMKNKEDILALKQKAYEVYEKLAVLAYVEEYINTTPNTTVTKEELIAKIEATSKVEKPIEEKQEEKIVYALDESDEEQEMDETAEDIAEVIIEEIEKEEIVAEEVEEILEQPFDDIEELLFTNDSNVKNDVRDIGDRKTPTLEEELEDTISLDVAAALFEKVDTKKSLNDQLQNNIQIDLNDRIAFVKHLFDGNQGDYNRVVSQLNTLKTEKEAKKFINKMVKPDYNWTDKEQYENRLIEIIERRFA